MRNPAFICLIRVIRGLFHVGGPLRRQLGFNSFQALVDSLQGRDHHGQGSPLFHIPLNQLADVLSFLAGLTNSSR